MVWTCNTCGIVCEKDTSDASKCAGHGSDLDVYDGSNRLFAGLGFCCKCANEENLFTQAQFDQVGCGQCKRRVGE
jgi:hypothetical protein